jgi:hypothetical protein
MLKKAIFIILISAFTLPLISEASYYTILLKNGNNIDVSNYWDLKSKILFYTDEGKVEIPKVIVSNISNADGVLEPKIGFYPTEEYFDQLEETKNKEELLSTETEEKPIISEKDITNEINDRLSIIDSNIANIKKNMYIYATQKKKLIDEKAKYEKMIVGGRNANTYSDPVRQSKRIDSMNNNISRIEEKIETIEQKIIQTENLIEKQQSMSKRLKKQLASRQ